MKPLPVYFTPLAEEDLNQIEDYIAASDPAAAARVRHELVHQAVALGGSPDKGMSLKESRTIEESGVRLWPVPRYRNYLLLYRVESHQVRLLRILHAARDWHRFFKSGSS